MFLSVVAVKVVVVVFVHLVVSVVVVVPGLFSSSPEQPDDTSCADFPP